YSSVTITNADPIENAVYLVKEGSKLKGIELVEVEGNAVDGLYFDKSYTEFFDVDEEVVSETMTLYAHYTPNTYKVDFVYIDADGNEQTIDSQNVKYTESATEPTAPEIEGKIFAGWSTSFEMISADTKVMARYIDKDEYAAVKLSRTKAISLAVGNSYSKLKAIIEPDYDYEVVWTSDDSEVAEVDENGVINAVKAGTATITATLPYTGASASVKVNVTADLDTTITCKNSADISLDSAGNVRNVRAGSNTVDEVLDKFLNDGLVVVNAQGEKLSGTDKVGTGASVCLYDGDTLIASAKVAVVGDYDGDGAVTARDVVMMNQHAVGKRDINDIQSIAVDVNGDGFVNNKDCSAVSRYLVGKALI
ncbi:MAG: Ig-like domain-containing protein, partial [Clostridia bacterium]|nr:Ig-like domain-containing protein [Clostridia bacterium]